MSNARYGFNLSVTRQGELERRNERSRHHRTNYAGVTAANGARGFGWSPAAGGAGRNDSDARWEGLPGLPTVSDTLPSCETRRLVWRWRKGYASAEG